MIYYHTSRDKITLPLCFTPLIPLPERSSSILLLLPPHCPSPLQYIPLSFLYLPVSTTVITLKRTGGQQGGEKKGKEQKGQEALNVSYFLREAHGEGEETSEGRRGIESGREKRLAGRQGSGSVGSGRTLKLFSLT